MNITVVTYDYPDSHRPVFPFVKALVDEWGKQGNQVTVISPFSITRAKHLTRYPEQDHPVSVTIVRPIIVSMSYRLKYKGESLTDRIHRMAVNKALKQLKQKPDVIYCHFWKKALFAYDYAKENFIPLVVASGESDLSPFLSNKINLTKCQSVSKVICVSSKNKNESIAMGLTTEEKCIVLPNAIDNSLFKVSDQNSLKRSLGIKESDFVVVFVGWFNERKGSKRLSDALKQISMTGIKALFIGSGAEIPDYPGILFRGVVPHNEIPNYLNCADVFVLPTLKEGCCNAIIEAMACGLPVVSSNLSFNLDVLDESNSIVIDPMNIREIASAIQTLRDDVALRQRLSEGALKKVASLTIDKRALRIIEFISEQK